MVLLPKMTCEEGDNHEVRLRTIYEHLFIDLLKENHFLAIEEFENWKSRLTKLGFDQLMRGGIVESLNKAFIFQDNEKNKISVFQGESPIIRRWKLPFPIFTNDPTKTKEENTEKENACAWALEYGLDLVDEKGGFRFDTIRNLGWKDSLNELAGDKVVDKCGGTRKVLEIGYTTLQKRGKIKDTRPLFGQDKDQLHEWDYQRTGMWKDKISNENLLIDLVTDFIIEDLKTREPDIFTDGKLNDQACTINWAEEYNNASDQCLSHCILSPGKALRRRHPYLPVDFEEKVRTNQQQYVPVLNSKAGKQYALECLAIDFANKGLGILDKSKSPHTYTLTHEELATWLSKHKGKQGEITVELVTGDTSQRIYKAFNNKTVDAYIAFCRNGESYEVQGPKRLTQRLLLELLPEGRAVHLEFNSHEKAGEEREQIQRSKEVRSKLCGLYASPFTHGTEVELAISANTTLKQDNWKRLILRSFTPLHEREALEETHLRNILLSIKRLSDHSNLSRTGKERLNRHINDLLALDTNPRLVLERIGTIPDGERYNTIRLIEEFFFQGIKLASEQLTQGVSFIPIDSPETKRFKRAQTYLNINFSSTNTIKSFIIDSLKADIITYSRHRARSIDDLEQFALEKDNEARDYYLAGNFSDAKNTYLFSESLKRLAKKKKEGIELTNPATLSKDDLITYANNLCTDINIALPANVLDATLTEILKTRTK